MVCTKQDHKQAISKNNSGRTPELFFKMAESVFWLVRKLCSNKRGLSSYEKTQHPEWLVLIFQTRLAKKREEKKEEEEHRGWQSVLRFTQLQKNPKKLKTLVEIFKNMVGNIPEWNFPGGNFPRGIHQGDFDWLEFSGSEFSWYCNINNSIIMRLLLLFK